MNRMADTVKNDETQGITACLLVTVHQRQNTLPVAASPRCGQSQGAKQIAMILDQILVDIPENMGQFSRENTADSHGIAVTPLEMLDLFNGMTKRVTVVEELAQPRFTQIVGNMVCLDSNRTLNQFGDHALQRRP